MLATSFERRSNPNLFERTGDRRRHSRPTPASSASARVRASAAVQPTRLSTTALQSILSTISTPESTSVRSATGTSASASISTSTSLSTPTAATLPTKASTTTGNPIYSFVQSSTAIPTPCQTIAAIQRDNHATPTKVLSTWQAELQQDSGWLLLHV